MVPSGFIIKDSRRFYTSMDVADEIKSRLDVVEIVGETVRLRKAGRIYKGLCPFHSEKTPSFIVYPEQGSWHCFGACSTGGDIFTFVMKRDNLDFGDALRMLAQRAGVELRRESTGDQSRERLVGINEAATLYYHELLRHHAAARYARDYLEQRRINSNSVESFQLGFSLQNAVSLQEYLETKGFKPDEMERAGLAIRNEVGGGYHDRFRGRLMFPIRNRRGQTIGFGARALGDEQPKYLNSPDTPLFNKSELLYGLDLAKDTIRSEKLAVIVEGYTDVIIAHQEGFKNVVAAMGTALTEKQLSQLQRLSHRFALALDADSAGAAATERGLELARTALKSKEVPVPVGPGLVSFQERLEAELSIIEIPSGNDPDEVILRSREEWKTLVSNAVPLVDYYFRAQTRDLDVKSSDGKFEATRRLLPLISEMHDPIQRRHYAQELARLVRLDERSILEQVESRLPNVIRSGKQSSSTPPAARAGARYSEHLLAMLLERPALIARVGFLTEEDFTGPERELWIALQGYNMGSGGDLEEALESAAPVAREEFERLRALARTADLPEADAARELEATAFRLRLQRDRDELVQLQYALVEATPEEGGLLQQRADHLRQRIATAQRELNFRSVLKNSSPMSS